MRWQTVVVHPANKSSRLIGRPTIFEAPITTASWPLKSIPVLFSIVIMPLGVHGRS